MSKVDHDALRQALAEILDHPLHRRNRETPVIINEGALSLPATPAVQTFEASPAPIVSTSPVYNVNTPELTRTVETGLTQEEVNHPNHYARWAMEPIEFIAKNDLPWWLANIVKYGMRYDAKDGLADLYKTRSYLEMKIRQLEGHPRYWEQPVATERKLNAPA